MKKLIGILFILIVLFCGWRLYVYWEKFDSKDAAKDNPAEVNPSKLPGMPYQLEPSYDLASRQGTAAMRAWLNNYGRLIQDPRKAWIELDFCRDIYRDNPVEAKRIFEDVKSRTPHSSPVWPRVKELEKTFE
jgi:hypothetical protein